MRAKFTFRTTRGGARRWMKMDLVGDGWPADGWAIPYSLLESQGLLSWFEVPPAAGEGLVNNQTYEMARTPSEHQIITAIETDFAELVRQAAPEPPGVTSTEYSHSVDLG